MLYEVGCCWHLQNSKMLQKWTNHPKMQPWVISGSHGNDGTPLVELKTKSQPSLCTQLRIHMFIYNLSTYLSTLLFMTAVAPWYAGDISVKESNFFFLVKRLHPHIKRFAKTEGVYFQSIAYNFSIMDCYRSLNQALYNFWQNSKRNL